MKSKTQKFDFIVVNYANGDMVGHTGIYEAIEKAVKAIDECVKDTVEAAKANDYEVIIIADHGNVLRRTYGTTKQPVWFPKSDLTDAPRNIRHTLRIFPFEYRISF